VIIDSPAAPDRRERLRRTAAPNEAIARVRLRTGQELTLIDRSDLGALVEGAARLLPGTRVDVHLITRVGRVLVRSRVVRAHVAALAADRVVYRGALAFDQPLDTS
jgi:hypothetical protein